ncbi:CAAX amino terminal protease self- immunity [Posidoniimonas polymericola]|uniref:CAAX amino terminal protease self-immunity n=1 Tax=Posidoniimonas polymericola TaxID=2528002 RepID=A0A5C5ZD29_9BACT|nr:CAAX prenyl protease-related protein [Posidoniimonas polymericola]TWT85234.1 CAAX amino terminal protease self- immunity [Posidoniimonas polymericola]
MPEPANQPSPDRATWGWFASRPVLPFVLPLAVFMLLATFEPSAPDPDATPEAAAAAEADNWFGLTFSQYPYAYAVRLLLGFATLAWCWRPIISQFPFRVSPLSVVVGVVGVVLWVAICWVDLEGYLVRMLGEENPAVMLLGLGPRPAFNPFQELADQPAWFVWAFLVVRFIGLAVLVPIIEELMLRGWLMRNLETDGYHPEFWQVAFGKAGAMTIVIGTAFPMLYHPEKLASLVWFSLVTWLMLRTKNFWDCVVAHAVTNFLLGVWVVTMGDWRLW